MRFMGPSNNPGYCLLPTDRRQGPTAENAYTAPWMEKGSWCLPRVFALTARILAQKGILQTNRRKCKHQPRNKPLISNGVLPARYSSAMVAQGLLR